MDLQALPVEIAGNVTTIRAGVDKSTPVLKLHDAYSRQSVHAIFSPDTVFVPQAGTWGLHGIVDVPNRPGDYVFFVTFGQTQGAHQFAESINEAGVLAWQSQPRQGFNDRRIKNFIHHNEDVSNIYLFLRTDAGRDYTYLGRLKYLDHDPTKERPVHFQWQILDWPLAADTISTANIMLAPVVVAQPVAQNEVPTEKHRLSIFDAPKGRTRGKVHSGNSVRNRLRQPDYLADHAANQELGLLGELLVLRLERQRLTAAGLHELAASVRHVSVTENDTAGYDILSFDDDGSKRFIEVKTTRSGADSDFFMSAKELVFAAVHSRSYQLYRLYDYVDATDSAAFFVLKGDVEKNGLLQLLPINYKVSIKAEEEQ